MSDVLQVPSLALDSFRLSDPCLQPPWLATSSGGISKSGPRLLEAVPASHHDPRLHFTVSKPRHTDIKYPAHGC